MFKERFEKLHYYFIVFLNKLINLNHTESIAIAIIAINPIIQD